VPESAPPPVPYLVWRIARALQRHPRVFIRLGNLETALHDGRLAGIAIDRPIFICGLARSGTTIILESLTALPGIVSHRYRDFPGVHLPLLWHQASGGERHRTAAAVERLHGDGIRITEESPEAIEEPIWMSFFPRLHDPTQANRLDATTAHPAFERFYTDHLRKILLLRHGRRIAIKGNYLVSRLGYLARLFPNAAILLTLRDPVEHVVSLARQHEIFTLAGRNDPRALDYLRALGHFEFGLDRRPINLGLSGALDEVLAAWTGGSEIEGWALYWQHIYGALADQLAADPVLAQRLHLVRFEQLAGAPRDCLAAILSACGIDYAAAALDRLAQRFRLSPARRATISDRDAARIEAICAPTAARFETSHLPAH
jgi:hypothetical protein